MGAQAVRFNEAARVKKDVEPLARQELSLLMLAANPLLAPGGFYLAVEIVELFEILLQSHGSGVSRGTEGCRVVG